MRCRAHGLAGAAPDSPCVHWTRHACAGFVRPAPATQLCMAPKSLPAHRDSPDLRRTSGLMEAGRAGVTRMIPDLRFVIGAVMATVLLGVTLFGLAAAMHISHQSKLSPLEASRLLAYTPDSRHRVFDTP